MKFRFKRTIIHHSSGKIITYKGERSVFSSSSVSLCIEERVLQEIKLRVIEFLIYIYIYQLDFNYGEKVIGFQLIGFILIFFSS
jgi:hypothetical protein